MRRPGKVGEGRTIGEERGRGSSKEVGERGMEGIGKTAGGIGG